MTDSLSTIKLIPEKSSDFSAVLKKITRFDVTFEMMLHEGAMAGEAKSDDVNRCCYKSRVDLFCQSLLCCICCSHSKARNV